MSGVSQYFLELVAVAIAACSSLLKHQRERHQRSGNMLRLTQAVESPADAAASAVSPSAAGCVCFQAYLCSSSERCSSRSVVDPFEGNKRFC